MGRMGWACESDVKVAAVVWRTSTPRPKLVADFVPSRDPLAVRHKPWHRGREEKHMINKLCSGAAGCWSRRLGGSLNLRAVQAKEFFQQHSTPQTNKTQQHTEAGLADGESFCRRTRREHGAPEGVSIGVFCL